MNDFSRTILQDVTRSVETEQIVVLTGARQTGKTTLTEMQLPERLQTSCSYVSFDDPDERSRFERNTVSLLESFNTRLVVLDEVQKLPDLFDPLKLVTDRRRKTASALATTFVLTGSSQLLLMKSIRETLAGRVALYHLHPFSLAEVIADNATSLMSRILDKTALLPEIAQLPVMMTPDRLRRIRTVTQRHKEHGGYPPVWHRENAEERMRWLRDYRATYLERDLADVGQVANITTFARAQKFLCLRTAQLLSISDVARDLGLAVNTIKRYLDLLSMTFQCSLLQPWHSNSGKRMIKSPKIYFSDTGLCRAILGDMTVDDGALYETWVFNELAKWASADPARPELYFYRTAAGMEVDFLVAARGEIIPIEVKSRETVTASDARSVEQFMKEYPDKTHIGLVIYQGSEVAELRPNIWGVPDWLLFGGIS